MINTRKRMKVVQHVNELQDEMMKTIQHPNEAWVSGKLILRTIG
jgi:hypothetical protein